MIEKIDELRGFLTEANSAFYIKSDVNRFYYTGFRSSAGCLIITQKRAVLLVDFRYFEAAQKSVTSEIEVICFSSLFDAVNKIFESEKIDSVYIEEDIITVSELNLLRDKLCAQVNTDFSMSEIILTQRSIKSDAEIQKIITAQKIAEKAYLEILNFVSNDVSEKKIAIELEYLMKKYGAERAAFDLIVVSGKNSSLPHGVPGDKLINRGDFITFDIGAVYDGYHSDMTRTVALDFVTDEMKKVYDIVLSAHHNAAKMIITGNTCADVDNAARSFISSQGYGKFFGHSTGHGVGLEIHEKPTVYKTYDTRLKNGMVITDEPGIYLPDKFGVRIEDMYLVKDNSAVSLANIDKELIIL